jgi:hypothetical protein
MTARTIKVSWKMGRPISLKAFIAHTKLQIAETHEVMLDRTVAHLSRGWAFVEILLDFTNLYIINTFATDETRLPVSLKAKIAFFKKHFRTVLQLHGYQDRADAIVSETNRLKLARHDILHGLALGESTEGARRYLRLDYRGKKLLRRTKEYSWEEASKIASEMHTLGKSISALLKEVGGRDIRKFFDNNLG